jgi:hypothetical protein
VTVQVTIVTPNGKSVGALFVIDVIEQLSLVVGAVNAGPVDIQFPGSTLKLCGPLQVIVGKMLFTTVMTCVQVLVLPLPSVTVHVTVVLPNGKTVGASLVTATVAQLSVVTGAVRKGDVTVQVPGSTLKLCGPAHVIMGSILSNIVTN